MKRNYILSFSYYLFIGGFVLFLISSFLFVILPFETKQFLGYQFYEAIEDYTHLNIHDGDIVVVERLPFLDYKKGTIITYQNNDDIPLYFIQQVTDMDVANYTVSFQNNTHIRKEQIKGKVVNVLPQMTAPILLLTEIMFVIVFLLALLFMYQIIKARLEIRRSESNRF